MAVSRTYLGAGIDNSAKTTYTFGGSISGTDTHIVFGVAVEATTARTIVSATYVGNVSGSQTVDLTAIPGSAQSALCGIFAAIAASDTSFTVTVTLSGAATRAAFLAWGTTGMKIATAVGSVANASGTNTVSDTVVVPADGAGFSIGFLNANASNTYSWTTYTEDVDGIAPGGGRRVSGASILGANSTSHSVTASTGSGEIGMATAAYPPLSVDYTVTANAGSYVYTGVAAALKVGRKLAANAGSYVYTGVAAAFKVGRRFAADVGSYALTGISATLLYGQILIAEAGSYTYSGIANILQAIVSMPANAGAYVYTGIAANVLGGFKVVASAGAYVYTGVSATMTSIRKMAANVGSYVLTGVVASQRVVMRNLVGSYVYTGRAAILKFGKNLIAGAGTYVLTGFNAVLVFRLPLAASTYWVKRKVQATLALARQVAPSLSKARRVQSTLSRRRQADPTLGD